MLANMTKRVTKQPVGRPPTLPTELMHRLVRKGYTNKAISEYLVDHGHAPASSAAVSAWKKRHGYEVRSPSAARIAIIPWKVAVKDARHRFYVCLALEARFQSGGYLAPKDESRRAKFIRELAELDAVIHYDRTNGWVAVPARPGIDNGLILDPRFDNDGRPRDFDPSL